MWACAVCCDLCVVLLSPTESNLGRSQNCSRKATWLGCEKINSKVYCTTHKATKQLKLTLNF